MANGRDLEHQHQSALFAWAEQESRWKCPELKLMFAIPNGGHRDLSTGIRLKREGVKAGIPDLFLPVARGGFHGFFIELKSPAGDASGKQEEWIAALRSQGYRAEVIHGWEAARAALLEYIQLPRSDQHDGQNQRQPQR